MACFHGGAAVALVTVDFKHQIWANDHTLSVVSSREIPAPGRQFLVFVVPRASISSPLNHLQSAERNFDLVVRFYEEPGLNEDLLREAEFIITGGLSKFHAASLFFKACPVQCNYDGFLFLDGDLEFDARELSSFLSFVHAAALDLAQPSLTRDSFGYWKMAYHQPQFLYRETSFVEVMAPYLSRSALDKTLATFTRSISAYGLDLIWPSLINNGRIGVVDAFQVRHRERVDHVAGSFYRYLSSIGIDPEEEERHVVKEYGVAPHHAHSLRGYVVTRNPRRPDGPPSLRSVPLHGVETFTERQWLIDLAMRLAALGPSRPEPKKADALSAFLGGAST